MAMSTSDDRVPVYYTADLCLFSAQAGVRHVLLIQRGWDPFKGMWALPGGHVEPDETSRDAAAREGAEETGVAVFAEDLALVGVFDTPGRDPRGRYVTVAWFGFLAGMPLPTAGDDAHAAQWVPVAPALTGHLAFDHRQILRKAFTLLTSAENTPADACP
jgi:8-oxo-dGTP diphosphatase